MPAFPFASFAATWAIAFAIPPEGPACDMFVAPHPCPADAGAALIGTVITATNATTARRRFMLLSFICAVPNTFSPAKADRDQGEPTYTGVAQAARLVDEKGKCAAG